MTAETVTFNMNNTVRVKLTPVGRAELERQAEELRKEFPKLGPWTYRVEDDGYTEFLLWQLMERLGHLCHCGGDIPFETDIQLKRGDLR